MESGTLRVVWLMIMVCTTYSLSNEAKPRVRRPDSDPHSVNFQRLQNTNGKRLRANARVVHSSDVTLENDLTLRRIENEPVNATPAQLAALADPDKEAKDTFFRECKMQTTVVNRVFLPSESLDTFCGEHTDAVVDCKFQMAKMMAVHDRGSDMDLFCMSIYQWFVRKYGHNCPGQCSKKMCKSTCQWLSDKKLYDDDTKYLRKRLARAKITKNELLTMEDRNATYIRRMEREMDKIRAGQLVVNQSMQYLNHTYYMMEMASMKERQSANDSLTAKLHMRSTDKARGVTKARYMAKKLDLESAELEQERRASLEKRAQDEVDEYKKAIAEKVEEVVKLDVKIEELEAKKLPVNASLQPIAAKIFDAQVDVGQKQQTVDSVRESLEEARTAGRDTGVYEELVMNKKKILRDATRVLRALELEKQKFELQIKEIDDEIGLYDKTRNETLQQQAQLEAVVPGEQMKVDMAHNFTINQTFAVTAAKDAYDVVVADRKLSEQAALNARTDYMLRREVQTQMEAGTGRAKRAMEKASEDLYKAERAVKKLEGDYSDIEKEQEDNEHRHQELSASFWPDYYVLVNAKAHHDQVLEGLLARRPEIVVLHRLG